MCCIAAAVGCLHLNNIAVVRVAIGRQFKIGRGQKGQHAGGAVDRELSGVRAAKNRPTDRSVGRHRCHACLVFIHRQRRNRRSGCARRSGNFRTAGLHIRQIGVQSADQPADGRVSTDVCAICKALGRADLAQPIVAAGIQRVLLVAAISDDIGCHPRRRNEPEVVQRRSLGDAPVDGPGYVNGLAIGEHQTQGARQVIALGAAKLARCRGLHERSFHNAEGGKVLYRVGLTRVGPYRAGKPSRERNRNDFRMGGAQGKHDINDDDGKTAPKTDMAHNTSYLLTLGLELTLNLTGQMVSIGQ